MCAYITKFHFYLFSKLIEIFAEFLFALDALIYCCCSYCNFGVGFNRSRLIYALDQSKHKFTLLFLLYIFLSSTVLAIGPETVEQSSIDQQLKLNKHLRALHYHVCLMRICMLHVCATEIAPLTFRLFLKQHIFCFAFLRTFFSIHSCCTKHSQEREREKDAKQNTKKKIK